MDEKEFIVSCEYPGYVFTGWAKGQMEARDASQPKIPYYQMFVLTPVSTYTSEDYEARGMKAEKKRCISEEVWKDLKPGDRVNLFFDDKGRVVMTALDQ